MSTLFENARLQYSTAMLKEFAHDDCSLPWGKALNGEHFTGIATIIMSTLLEHTRLQYSIARLKELARDVCCHPSELL